MKGPPLPLWLRQTLTIKKPKEPKMKSKGHQFTQYLSLVVQMGTTQLLRAIHHIIIPKRCKTHCSLLYKQKTTLFFDRHVSLPLSSFNSRSTLIRH